MKRQPEIVVGAGEHHRSTVDDAARRTAVDGDQRAEHIAVLPRQLLGGDASFDEVHCLLDQALELFDHVVDRADLGEVVERKRNVVRVFELFDQFHDLDRRQTDVVDEIAVDVDDRALLGELVDKLLQASGIILAFFHSVVIDWGGC